ncbi:hypothetical protein ACQKE8_23390, partial [Sphingobium limneticum]|uniref:hypothetical protein n=1 Tax=Sphingobium limneticum TaxID=1007511 RepID=UPI003D04D472
TANGSQNSPTGAATYRPSKLTPTGLRNRRATEDPFTRSFGPLSNGWEAAFDARKPPPTFPVSKFIVDAE